MTAESFNRPGAVDLSALGQPAAPQTTGRGGASYVQDLDEASFDAVVSRSMQYPVVIELHSARANAQEVSDALIAATNAAGGKWLLARVDVDAQPRIAAALQVQAVPTVIAVIAGQVAPLFQGTRDAAEIQAVLEQLGQVAIANGLTGRAEPVAASTPDQAGADGEAATPQVDPRFAAADQAMVAGDFPTAVAEFEKVLAAAPADQEAVQGLAQAKLLQRSMTFDPAAIVARASAEPGDVEAQLQAADLELINGDAVAAFDRVLELIRENRDADLREQLRLRLLELFDAVGKTDPAVLKARRKLSTALFA